MKGPFVRNSNGTIVDLSQEDEDCRNISAYDKCKCGHGRYWHEKSKGRCLDWHENCICEKFEKAEKHED